MADGEWYSRTVFFVRDATKAMSHYTEALAFSGDWQVPEGEGLIATQVSRDGLEIILYQDASRAGGGRIFVSLGPGEVDVIVRDLESRGVEVAAGHWGMPVRIVQDLDGNELLFYDDELNEQANR